MDFIFVLSTMILGVAFLPVMVIEDISHSISKKSFGKKYKKFENFFLVLEILVSIFWLFCIGKFLTDIVKMNVLTATLVIVISIVLSICVLTFFISYILGFDEEISPPKK